MIGQRVAHYRITAAIGAGGMGQVYRATDTKLGRDVALKVLPPEMASTSERLERFRREARAVAALNDPHVVTIYSVEEADGIHFLTMELVDGEPLDRLIPHGGMAVPQMLEIAGGVADALCAAHDKGIVHRDLKPANVMVTKAGSVKVLDFGLARMTAPAASALVPLEDERTEVRTSEGMVMGTMPYMSPEQLHGQALDHRTDIFSFGIMLYEMTSGERPFRGDSSAALASAILRDAPRPLPERRDDLPEGLIRIISRCLQKNATDRFPSARDLRGALGGVIDGDSSRTVPSRSSVAAGSASARRRVWIAAMLLIAILALAAAAIMIRRAGTHAGAISAAESVAVLPFKTSDREDEFLADGLTDAVTATLSVASALRVIASTSVVQYRIRPIEPARTAQQLRVDRLVTGTLSRSGESLTLEVVLLDAAGTQIWRKNYDRAHRDLSTLGREVGNDVLLRIRGADAQQDAGAPRHTPSTEAYTAYLRGTAQAKKATPASVRKAMELYGEAIAADPLFAPAHSALASAYARQATMGFVTPADAKAKVRAAAARAVELDPADAQALWLLASSAAGEGDHGRARELRRRALAANPNFASARFDEALDLLRQRRFDEAEVALRKMEDLDPLSAEAPAVFGWYLYFEGEYDRSIVRLRKTIELFPDFPNSYAYLTLPLAEKQRYEEAMTAIDKACALTDNPSIVTWRAYVLARGGRQEEARQVAEQVRALAAERHVVPYYRAWLYAALGDADEAFAMLRRARDDDDWRMRTFAARDPALVTLRDDPRWRELFPPRPTATDIAKPASR